MDGFFYKLSSKNSQAFKKLNAHPSSRTFSDSLIIYYQNARSLKNKLDQLSNNIHLLTVSPHIIIITETWLSDFIPDSLIQLKGYDIFRLDRNPLNSIYQRGGGVLIAVKPYFKAKSCSISHSSCEHIFVSLSFSHNKIIIGAIYVPQYAQANDSIYIKHVNIVDELKIKYPDSHLCLFGDYNLSHINWTNDGSLNFIKSGSPDKNIVSAAKILLDSFSLYNLKQYFPINPSKSNTLDLFFSSLEFSVDSPPEPLVNIDTHHYP